MGHKGLGWMVLAQVFFAGMNVCTRLGARDLPWSEIAAARFLIGALIALAIAWFRSSSLRITDRPSTWRRSVYGTIAAMGTFYALGSSRIALGDAATLSATGPIFVALLSGPLLGERVGRRVALAIGLGFAGIVAVVRPSLATEIPVAAVATAGAAFYALAMIWLRKIGPGESHEAVVLHFSVVALVSLILIGFPVWHRPDWGSGWFLLGAGLGGGGAQIAMTRAYALHRAAPVTALSGLGIVLTYLLAIPIFGDQPSGLQVAGSLLVIAASVLLTLGGEPAPSRVSARDSSL
ncbi:MAG TPA: DMT family transporter [Gemmatimonadales bacterium]|jgi:drug/metabolite transporter (DMT)-like permease|nr:DMT family transporter [Gemmatimonadales bacterium]